MIDFLNSVGARFFAFAMPMLWQSAILIGFLFVVDALLRRKVRATARYALWMLVLVKLVLPPTLAMPTSPVYWWHGSSLSPATPPSPPEVSLPSATSAATRDRIPSLPPHAARPHLTAAAIMLLIWLVITGCLGLWVICRFLQAVDLSKRTTAAPARALELLDSCRRALDVRRTVSLRCARGAGSPAVCGLIGPVIIVPDSVMAALDESGLRFVLLHELAHCKRGDLLVGHAQIVLQVFYWYNPLLWLANARIRRVREEAVDEMVQVGAGSEAANYPAAMLQVAKLAVRRPILSIGLTGMLAARGGLAERIREMNRKPPPTSARLGARAATTMALLALVALPMACQQRMISATTGNSFIVRVSNDGSIHLRTELVALETLQAKLTAAAQDNPKVTLTVQADSGASANQVLKVIQAATAVHVPVLSFVDGNGQSSAPRTGSNATSVSPVQKDLSTPAVKQKPAPGYADFPLELQRVLDEAKQRINNNGEFYIAGRVSFSDGAEIEAPRDIQVNFEENYGGSHTCRVLAGGWFVSYGINQQHGDLAVRAFNYLPIDFSTDFHANTINYVAFEMERVPDNQLSTIQGIVTDQTGAPLAGVYIGLAFNFAASPGDNDKPARNARTGSDGRFAFSGLSPAAYRLYAIHPGRVRTGATITTRSGAALQTNLTLFPLKSVTFDYVCQNAAMLDFTGGNLTRGTMTWDQSKQGIIFTSRKGYESDLVVGQRGDQMGFSCVYGSGNGNGIYDAGAVDFDSITKAPGTGYSMRQQSCVVGHVYVVKTYDGHYVKLVVKEK
ncbi:MAG: M56 family metallopeptidase [Verrucomicrobiota bacterium]